MKKFYQLVNNADSDVAELMVYGDITSYKWYEDDVSAYDLSKDLQSLGGKALKVRINSYGGEVSQGLAIYNLLKDYAGEVTTICDGFACSAASVIFMAGKNRLMPKSSLLMIHNAWSYASGDANDLRKAADDLEKITEPSVQIYLANSNLEEETIRTMMDKETWITADEAYEYGMATAVVEDSPQMSLKDDMLSKLVHRNKQLEKEMLKIKEQQEPGIPNEPEQKKGWFF